MPTRGDDVAHHQAPTGPTSKHDVRGATMSDHHGLAPPALEARHSERVVLSTITPAHRRTLGSLRNLGSLRTLGSKHFRPGATTAFTSGRDGLDDSLDSKHLLCSERVVTSASKPDVVGARLSSEGMRH